MRSAKLLFAVCVAGSLMSGAVEAQSDKKKAVTGGNFAAPKSAVTGPAKTAPSKMTPKSQTNTAPRPTSAAPLTAAECTGLGGKIVPKSSCSIINGQACSTVDTDGVVRTKCINR